MMIGSPTMQHFNPDNSSSDAVLDVSVFLAGTIDMGNSDDWQSRLIIALGDEFKFTGLKIYNPRVEFWNDKNRQQSTNKAFRKQVLWEQSKMNSADIVFFNLLKDSKSPITLMELGQCLMKKPQDIVVCCSKDFYRYGNVEIMCKLYGAALYNDPAEAMAALIIKIKSR